MTDALHDASSSLLHISELITQAYEFITEMNEPVPVDMTEAQRIEGQRLRLEQFSSRLQMDMAKKRLSNDSTRDLPDAINAAFADAHAALGKLCTAPVSKIDERIRLLESKKAELAHDVVGMYTKADTFHQELQTELEKKSLGIDSVKHSIKK